MSGRARTSRAGVALLLALALSGCGATTSTEVGVRTRLVWFFEKRGAQEVYPPGGVYFFLPLINSWNTLPISQQNLLMMSSESEGDRLGRDDITFKTRDGNNVYIDVNVMWRVDPKKADYLISNVGQSALEIKERLVRPLSRSVVRDVFNEITSEEYYQVTVKNRMAANAKDQLSKELAPFGVLVDQLQVQQHRFDKEYQDAINAQKQAEADVQTLMEQQKNMASQKRSELEGKCSEWNKRLEDALGEAGRIKNEADGYYQTKTNLAKATIAVAQAEAEGVRKEAEALGKLGGDAYVKMQVAKQFAKKKILIVPASNVSTMNVNDMVNTLLGKTFAPPATEPTAAPETKR
ncbi:MAG: SPFH domain-containing protein [Thermoanaerobaculia bacterium]